MYELIFFLIGILLGGVIGIVTMSLMQINHLHNNNYHRKDDDE